MKDEMRASELIDSVKVTSSINVDQVREDFPILKTLVRGKPLVYLDNAATTQKPKRMIDALKDYYENTNSNIHRGVHFLSEKATERYEQARVKVKNFLNAISASEVIFTRGATEAINLVVNSYGKKNIGEGDEIIISTMEHHANIVPWQILCEEKGAKLKIIPINDKGELLFEEFEKLISPKTKFVSIVHVSNTLGTINPVKEIIKTAHSNGIPVLVDGSQSIPHQKVDMQELDCDFFVFSGHKLFAPTGIGALYAKANILESMPPYQSGGDMIRYVSFEKTLFNDIPNRFEAGTPNISGAIGLGASIDYLNTIGMDKVANYEAELLKVATEKISEIEGLKIIGQAENKSAVISFVLENVHPHDIGTIFDSEGVAIRTGHHCTQPLMQRFGIPATARASFAFYNKIEEIDALIKAINKVKTVFG